MEVQKCSFMSFPPKLRVGFVEILFITHPRKQMGKVSPGFVGKISEFKEPCSAIHICFYRLAPVLLTSRWVTFFKILKEGQIFLLTNGIDDNLAKIRFFVRLPIFQSKGGEGGLDFLPIEN